MGPALLSSTERPRLPLPGRLPGGTCGAVRHSLRPIPRTHDVPRETIMQRRHTQPPSPCTERATAHRLYLLYNYLSAAHRLMMTARSDLSRDLACSIAANTHGHPRRPRQGRSTQAPQPVWISSVDSHRRPHVATTRQVCVNRTLGVLMLTGNKTRVGGAGATWARFAALRQLCM
jgi:hypothetical protein